MYTFRSLARLQTVEVADTVSKEALQGTKHLRLAIFPKRFQSYAKGC